MKLFLSSRMLAALLVCICPGLGKAQDSLTPSVALRSAFATILGLNLNGDPPQRDGGADVYRSFIDNSEAPRLLTRLEVGGNGCRARTTSALQFPGRWAVLSLTMTDFKRVTDAVGYASVDDLIAERTPRKVEDPAVTQIVLSGGRLQCTTRLSLDPASEDVSGKHPARECGDRIDITVADAAQRQRVRNALAFMAGKCGIKALKR